MLGVGPETNHDIVVHFEVKRSEMLFQDSGIGTTNARASLPALSTPGTCSLQLPKTHAHSISLETEGGVGSREIISGVSTWHTPCHEP